MDVEERGADAGARARPPHPRSIGVSAAPGEPGGPRIPPPPPPPGSEVDPLARALDHPSASVRHDAVQAHASDLDGRRADLLLTRLGGDGSSLVRRAIVAAFAARPLDERLRAARIGLSDPHAGVRLQSVELLDDRTPDAAPLLVRALLDRAENVVRRAVALVGGPGDPDALAILWTAGRRAAGAARATIVEALDRWPQAALARLAAQGLESPDTAERVFALVVAARRGRRDARELLADALSDPDPEVRDEALSALADTGAPVDVDVVGARASDPVPDVRRRAVAALRTIDDERAVPYLVHASYDPVEEVARAARGALIERRSPALARLLVRALHMPSLRHVAGDLLAQMGGVAVDELTAELERCDDGMRSVIVGVLSSAGQTSDVLIDLRDRRTEQRRRAVEVVAATHSAGAYDALVERLDDPDPGVRARAAEVLGDLGDVRAAEPLKRIAAFDPDVAVVAAAELALRKVAPEPARGRSARARGA